ncbi:MAG: ATP-binding protein [Actinobacteria bacterium]|nr:MAG: ATP-binding protein [Actinomycetota bacterium]
MNIERIGVKELVEECLETKHAVAREHGVSLEVEPDNLEATLYGDRRLLRAAVANLVEMAIRHNRPGGKVTVGFFNDPNRESIVVTDNGRGLPYEDLRSIRDLFCRAATTEVYEVDELDASLLGFSVVKDIADLHGGRVGVRSMEGEGSTFTLHLPRRHRGAA